MKKSSADKSLFLFIQNAVATIMRHPLILYPLCISVFIQLLILEILYFAPRWPLSLFFGPIIRRLYNEAYLHYPFNFQLVPKLFFYAQIPLYFLITAYLSAMTVSMIASIRNEKTISLRSAFRKTRSSYIHIVIAAILTFLTIFPLLKGYELIFERALRIKSETGVFFIMRSIVVYGRPYFNLLIDVIVTTLYIFVIPAIVIDKLKIHRAFTENFKILSRSFFFMLGIVLIPGLIYVPVLMLRSIIGTSALSLTMPGLAGLIIALSVFAKLLIEALVLTATTTYYLMAKEKK
ncbi:MAG: hypothetical protein ABIJ41_02945 [Candidatus Omnitrophota bacterium]